MNGDDSDPPSDRIDALATVDVSADPDGGEHSAAGQAGAVREAPPPAAKILWRRPPALLLGAVFLITLVMVGVYLAKRQLDRAPATTKTPPAAADYGPAPTLEIPAPAETALAGAGPAPGKILNTADDELKAAANSIERVQSPSDGEAGELPAAPDAGAIGGNAGMQDAAKEAAKLFSPGKSDASEIDLSTDDGAAALQSLERAAAAQAATGIAAPAMEPDRDRGAGDAAGLIQSLEAERRHSERQAAEISRLAAEISASKAQGPPAARQAGAALAFNDLAIKARSGEPYRRELDLYLRLASSPPAREITDSADGGLPTLAELKQTYPAMRNAALAATRRNGARGSIARLGANLAALVNLRPAGPVPGAGALAILARAEAKLMADDLAGALAELGGLTGAARVEAATWKGEAARRVQADAALAALNRDLVSSLGAAREYQ